MVYYNLLWYGTILGMIVAPTVLANLRSSNLESNLRRKREVEEEGGGERGRRRREEEIEGGGGRGRRKREGEEEGGGGRGRR